MQSNKFTIMFENIPDLFWAYTAIALVAFVAAIVVATKKATITEDYSLVKKLCISLGLFILIACFYVIIPPLLIHAF